MKKILFLIHDMGPGGAEKVLVNLVNNMDKEQFDITIIALFGGGVNEQFIAPHIHYKSIFRRTFRGNSHLMKILSPKTLHRLFIKDTFDVEIAYLEGPSARIISGCTNKNTKLFSWIHIQQKTINQTTKAFRNIKEANKCYNSFDSIVCVSNEVKDTFLQQLDIMRPTVVLYNTNESDKIVQMSNENVDEIIDDQNVCKIVCVGKLLKSKGFDRVLRIVQKLNSEGTKCGVYILGVGPEESELKAYIHNNEMEGYAFLLGYQTNPYKYMSKCNLFVCSSFAEGFSTATTEALILGIPVCTVNVSGMKEMLGDSEYGLIVDNTDKALYEGMKKMVSNAELRNKYKLAACERGKLFSTVNTVTEVEKLVNSE